MSDDDKDETTAQVLPREPISALGSANAPMLVFDEAAFFGVISRGVGEIALAATRYCEARGIEVLQERVLTAHLRGSLPAIRTLKYAVDKTLEMLEAEREREAAGDRAMAILREAAEPEFRN